MDGKVVCLMLLMEKDLQLEERLLCCMYVNLQPSTRRLTIEVGERELCSAFNHRLLRLAATHYLCDWTRSEFNYSIVIFRCHGSIDDSCTQLFLAVRNHAGYVYVVCVCFIHVVHV